MLITGPTGVGKTYLGCALAHKACQNGYSARYIHNLRSTLITSQLPVDRWHAIIADPTLADAILDRLVHTAYRLNLDGESMRKKKPAAKS